MICLAPLYVRAEALEELEEKRDVSALTLLEASAGKDGEGMEDERVLVSKGTVRNWKRLKVAQPEVRLQKRANKGLSGRHIFPKEYCVSPDTKEWAEETLTYILSKRIGLERAVNSLCAAFLLHHGLARSAGNDFFASPNKYIDRFLSDLARNLDAELAHKPVPRGEPDCIGLIYQYLQQEGRKNALGSYFTPRRLLDDLLQDTAYQKTAVILDPCCGTGSFLLQVTGAPPSHLYGIDIDPLAVKIAKANLFVKFRDTVFDPQIYCADFLLMEPCSDSSGKDRSHPLAKLKFDAIISNPPWGAARKADYARFFPAVTSGESFSYFLVQAMRYLRKNGEIRFLLPEAILNVKKHADIRREILARTTIQRIILYQRCFSGVFTKVLGMVLRSGSASGHSFAVHDAQSRFVIDQDVLKKNRNCVFTLLDKPDRRILEQVYALPYSTLEQSRWALGIVTGNNREKVSPIRREGYEPLFTGKDIRAYRLGVPTAYIHFDRSALQQAAPDDMYRAPEKLVYKFITRKLTFAYDDGGRLFLNSANIVIPNIPGISIKAALAFLNSEVFQYIYIKKFGEIKILRGNLEQLPFPVLSSATDKKLAALAERASAHEPGVHTSIQQLIYEIFQIKPNDIRHIRRALKG